MPKLLGYYLTKRWLRRYQKDKSLPSVRAVLLGDYSAPTIILSGIHERRELDVLSREVFSRIAQRAVALDIGASIGNHASIFAKHFDRVVAFEPNPLIAAVLRANALDRQFEAVEKGISDSPGTRYFSIPERDSSISHVTNHPTGTTIEVDTLDRLAETLGLYDVSFIKIDVEEHEAEVLSGGKALLSSKRPVIAMEGLYERNPGNGARVRVLLDELGYRYFYRLVPSRWPLFDLTYGTRRSLIPRLIRPESPLSLDPIDRIGDEDYRMIVVAAEPLR